MLTLTSGVSTVTLRNQERASTDSINSNRIIQTNMYNKQISKVGFPWLKQYELTVYETDKTRVDAFLTFVKVHKGETLTLGTVTYTGDIMLINGVEVIEEQDHRGYSIKLTFVETNDV